VDQIQIHIVQLELFQTGFQRRQRIALIVVPQLGGDEQVAARQRAGLQRGADAFLVLVDRGGVDGAVTDLQRFADRAGGLFNTPRPNCGIRLPSWSLMMGCCVVMRISLCTDCGACGTETAIDKF
jgi:hypothetical protein